ncbi:GH3 auxin-responsive promoter family protein [Paraliomyxa miuraensis]|uniref:GH3 auxin-responsive promoter family protein n=1 Tax=Paraliomyxa miuraensis TaxID=376150 RepID=UPI00224FE2D5|nr:GH3 auxin-responsive promoter family protein [Paraliomyxa miuraensis]MCX4240778.1 GH3 auxin-responsive promoter family protein [Paraliomyxa miuraensis]
MFASREAQSFLASLAEPERVQDEFLQQQILAPNVECELGRRHAFDKIASIEDYRRAVPISTYDGFAELIERAVQDGEQGLLTSEPIKRFFLTSGSTSRSKYIPVTNRFVRNKSRTFGIYWSLVFGAHPTAQSGRMVTNFSDSGKAVRAPGGLPCSSESAYWAGVTRATQLKERPIIPKAVAQIGDSDSRYYAIARILLEEAFSVIMTLNPSTILLLFQKVAQYADALVEDVERGGIGAAELAVSDEVRDYVATNYAGNPERAAALRELAGSAPGLLAHRVWPALDLAICWRSPMLQPYIELLAPHFEGVAQRDYILMASEGVMAVPIEDGCSGGVLALGANFYEFVPEERIEDPDPPVLSPHELEVGRTYVIILSNASGLYRYNIGDVVRVVRLQQRTPVIEFLHRAGSTCSLTGEKLTEGQVTAAVSDVAEQLGLRLESFTLAPAKSGFPHYVAMIELQREAERSVLAELPRRLDEALEQHNMEYGSKRSSQRLAAPQVWLVRPGGYEQRRRQRLAGGTSDSQLKPTHLTRDANFVDQFEIVERFHAD